MIKLLINQQEVPVVNLNINILSNKNVVNIQVEDSKNFYNVPEEAYLSIKEEDNLLSSNQYILTSKTIGFLRKPEGLEKQYLLIYSNEG